MVIYFDTETTGLYPGHIIQLSYIMEKDGESRGKNFYFYAEYIEPSAIAVHGYTREKLAVLSKGKVFKDYAEEIYQDFFNARLIVAHNCNFDINFLIAEFKYLGLQFRYHDSFDSMRYFTPVMKLPRKSSGAYKYPKLSELCDFYGVTEEEIAEKTQEIFGEKLESLHEARFDTTALYLAVKKSNVNI